MNLVDVVIIAVLAFALIAGVASGAFPQLGGLAGAIGGGALAILVLLPFAQTWLETLDPPVRAVVVLVGIVGIVGLGEAIGSGLGSRIRARLIGHSILGNLDRAAGGLLGLAQGILVVWLVGGVLAAGPVPQVAAAVQRSAIVRGLAGVLPPPTQIVGELGKWLDASGLPDVFVGFEPFPAPKVDPPTDALAQAIAAKAVASTLIIRADACGYVLSGTGFVVRPGYIVTNAHVVAGSRSISIGRDGGAQTRATAVLFDPELDVALLYAPGLAAPPLTLADGIPQPRDPGRCPRPPGWRQPGHDPGGRHQQLQGPGPRHLRHEPGDPRDHRAARRDHPGRQRRSGRPPGRDRGRRRLRPGPDRPERGLCPFAGRRGRPDPARPGPDGGGRHRTLHPLIRGSPACRLRRRRPRAALLHFGLEPS